MQCRGELNEAVVYLGPDLYLKKLAADPERIRGGWLKGLGNGCLGGSSVPFLPDELGFAGRPDDRAS